jgi:hypothetical protein
MLMNDINDGQNNIEMQSVFTVDSENKQVVFGEGRPNCLILDEIDGATGDSGRGESSDKVCLSLLPCSCSVLP